MEKILLAILACLLIWWSSRLAFRWWQRRRDEAESLPASSRTISRLGEPGTITEAQIGALKSYGIEAKQQWSNEEAGSILASIHYLRAVITEETGKKSAKLKIQNELLVYIMTDQALRSHAQEWSRRRQHNPTHMPKEKHYRKMASKLQTLT